MDEKELSVIRAKKDPLKTEMRRYVQAMMAAGKTKEEILANVTWERKSVLEIFDRLNEERRPPRYHVSIREPLETDCP